MIELKEYGDLLENEQKIVDYFFPVDDDVDTERKDLAITLRELRAKGEEAVKDMKVALEAWLLFESELRPHPCPDLALRASYRKRAKELTQKAIRKVADKAKE